MCTTTRNRGASDQCGDDPPRVTFAASPHKARRLVAALFAVVASACACAAGAQPSFAMPVALAPATPPISSPTPASVDFGSVQMGMSSDPVTVTLLNSGGGSLSFWRLGIASSSANPRDFSVVPGGTCTTAAALGSAESCTVLVRFKPTTSGVRG